MKIGHYRISSTDFPLEVDHLFNAARRTAESTSSLQVTLTNFVLTSVKYIIILLSKIKMHKYNPQFWKAFNIMLSS
jgi:hypothetical protein